MLEKKRSKKGYIYMAVSKNNGTPKSSHFYRVFPLFSPSILRGMFTRIFVNTHIGRLPSLLDGFDEDLRQES